MTLTIGEAVATLQQRLVVAEVGHDAQVAEFEDAGVVGVEVFGEPDGLLVGDLGSCGEGGGCYVCGVAEAPDVGHDGGGGGGGGGLLVVKGVGLGVEFEAEGGVDEEGAGFGVVGDVPLSGRRVMGGKGRSGEGGGVDGVGGEGWVEGFGDEGVGGIAGGPDAHADVDGAFFFGVEGVDTAFRGGFVGIGWDGGLSELFYVVGGFDLDALALVVADGIVGEAGVEQGEDFRGDVVEGDLDVLCQGRVELAEVLVHEVA